MFELKEMISKSNTIWKIEVGCYLSIKGIETSKDRVEKLMKIMNSIRPTPYIFTGTITNKSNTFNKQKSYLDIMNLNDRFLEKDYRILENKVSYIKC